MKTNNIKCASLLAKVAHSVAVSVSNKACVYIYHQPKETESVKALRKF